MVFEAPAVVLATGGIGKSFKVTSNSWEYTGDGHALAMRAGAALLNMEFVQFHPTGMVWPPSVRGILVTESVRGDGGVLTNSEGKRFMFEYIPDVFKKQYADSESEADGWYKDPDNNRRPPELLPRDEVARAINNEVKEGRGSPQGGVFLDVSTRLPAEEIRRRLPSMWHQFKELADVDITAEPMEVGPTCHYVMGGVEVDPDSAAASVPGLFAAGEVAGGMHGSNRLGGNSLSDLLVFGRRAGVGCGASTSTSCAPSGPRWPRPTSRPRSSGRCSRSRPRSGRTRTRSTQDLQQSMHDLVGIIRARRGDRGRAAAAGEVPRARATRVKVRGRRAFNPGWHLALDLRNMVRRQRVRGPGGARAAGEPGRAHPRRLPGHGRRCGGRSTSLHARTRTAASSCGGSPCRRCVQDLIALFDKRRSSASTSPTRSSADLPGGGGRQ